MDVITFGRMVIWLSSNFEQPCNVGRNRQQNLDFSIFAPISG